MEGVRVSCEMHDFEQVGVGKDRYWSSRGIVGVTLLAVGAYPSS